MLKYFIKHSEITFILILINVILFLLETLAGGSTNTVVAANFGIFYSPVFFDQPRRAITAMFLHFGAVHLFMNMYALYCIGPLIENTFGKWKYLLIYLFSGVCGNLMVLGVEMMTGSYSFSAGASGAIFGLLGSIVALFLSLPESIRSRMNIKSVTSAILLNIMIGFLPGISMSAHLGGLIGGFLISFIIIKLRKPTYSSDID